jgi:hypothetical protein
MQCDIALAHEQRRHHMYRRAGPSVSLVATFARQRGSVCIVVLLGTNMSKVIVGLGMAVLFATLPDIGSAKGCLKGAAVGGVVGHVAGHHAIVGAAAGCVIEHHREKVKDKAAR